MGAIFRRELKAYFTSPIAYIFIAVFYLYTGFYYVNYNVMYATADMSYVFSSVFIIMMLMLPLITMRLMSEEKRQKTDQCLLTAPISLFSIVMGKFFAALCVFLGAMLIYVFFLISLTALGAVIAWPTVIGSLVGLLLLGASFISIGIFISSTTENQVVSAILSFIINMAFYLIDMVAGNITLEPVRKVMAALGFYSKYTEFSTGILNIGSLIFFLSVIFIFSFLTVRVLEKRRWAD